MTFLIKISFMTQILQSLKLKNSFSILNNLMNQNSNWRPNAQIFHFKMKNILI